MRGFAVKNVRLTVVMILLLAFFCAGTGFCAEIIGKVTGITGNGSDYENVEISCYGKKLTAGQHIAIVRKGKMLTEGVVVVSGNGGVTASFYKKGVAKVGDGVARCPAMELVFGSPYPVYKRPVFTTIDCHTSKYSNDSIPGVVIIESPVMNAFSTYYYGKPVVLVTDRMTKALFAYSYYLAIGEVIENNIAFKGIRFLALTEALKTNELPPCPRLPDGYQRQKVAVRAVDLYNAMVYFVLAHEAGHISCGHVRQAFAKVGLTVNNDEYCDAIKISELWLDREMEKEADRTAVELTLEKYGKTGEAAIKYLALFMQYVEALEGTRPEYLCTHPHWSTRYNYMTAMIKKYRSE